MYRLRRIFDRQIHRHARLLVMTMLVISFCSHEALSETRPEFDSERIISIADFSRFKLEAWEEIRFNGLTSYQVVKSDLKGDDKAQAGLKESSVLRAESKGSASGLLLKKKIDLKKTPYLNWRWKKEKGLEPMDETIKQGDDYAARIYLIHSGGWFFWQTMALNYVWSSRESKGSSWPNAYASENALMMAVRDKLDQSDTWYIEKRHVKNDFKLCLGEDISEISGVAIMTDTDDSHGHAIVYYGDIFFSEN